MLFPRQLLCTATLLLLVLVAVVRARQSPPYVSKSEYMSARAKLVAEQNSYAFDTNVTLNADEKAANDILHAIYMDDFKRWSAEGLETPPSHNFFRARSLIDRTRIFALLKKMPKGALLHAHNTALGNFSYLIEKVTYMPNCYINMSMWAVCARGVSCFLCEPLALSLSLLTLTLSGTPPTTH
jgi:adenosine deaminase CECR1